VVRCFNGLYQKENFMKKRLIYSSVLTALLSASSIALAGGPEIIPEPDYFSGFYIGGMGGVNHDTWEGDATIVQQEALVGPFGLIKFIAPGPLNTTTIDGGAWAGFGGIQGGFGRQMGEFYAGVVAWGDWGDASQTTNQNNSVTTTTIFSSPIIIIPSVAVGNSISTSQSTTVRVGNEAGVAAKLGWVVAPTTMLYTKLGASWADVKVSNSVSGSVRTTVTVTPPGTTPIDVTTLFSGSNNNEETKSGFLVGVGCEQFVWEDVVSINVEYDYTNYGSVSTGPSSLTAQLFNNITGFALTQPFTTKQTTQARIDNVQVSKLLAGLNFYFGRHWI
jgi:opacity protein-like surface antigen